MTRSCWKDCLVWKWWLFLKTMSRFFLWGSVRFLFCSNPHFVYSFPVARLTSFVFLPTNENRRNPTRTSWQTRVFSFVKSTLLPMKEFHTVYCFIVSLSSYSSSWGSLEMRLVWHMILIWSESSFVFFHCDSARQLQKECGWCDGFHLPKTSKKMKKRVYKVYFPSQRIFPYHPWLPQFTLL